jgi:hypothetical protein
VAANYINYNIKWTELESKSLFEWLDANALNNINLTFDPPTGLMFPKYFSDTFEAPPTAEEFK